MHNIRIWILWYLKTPWISPFIVLQWKRQLKSIAPPKVYHHPGRCEKWLGNHFSQWSLPLLCEFHYSTYIYTMTRWNLQRSLIVVHKMSSKVWGRCTQSPCFFSFYYYYGTQNYIKKVLKCVFFWYNGLRKERKGI